MNDEISLVNAKKIVDLSFGLGIKTIILIGGEPTIYSEIFELITYIKSKNIKVVLVTNGILLFNDNILDRFVAAGVDSYSISLKASTKEKYKTLTQFDGFEMVLGAIKNLSERKCSFSVSTVLTADNIDDFLDGLVEAKKCGAKSFSLSFCYNFDMGESSKREFLQKNNPYLLAEKYSNIYGLVCEKLEGCSFSLEQSLPLCVWDEEIIKKMDKDRHLKSICQLLRGNGILFDTDMSLIPCNAMYKLKYGKYGEDFIDKETFLEYLNTEKVKKLFAKLRGVPSLDCLKCDDCHNCGGGCVTNWTNYSFEELKSMKKKGD